MNNPENRAEPDDVSQNSTNSIEVDVERAKERQAWRRSPEYRQTQRTQRAILYFLVPAGVLGAFVGWIYAVTSNSSIIYDNQGKYILYGAGIGAGVVGYGGIIVINATRSRARRDFRDRKLLGQAQEELKQADEEITGGATDFGALWSATQKRLDYYHRIATTQAERSFMYGQIAAGAGFVVIVISALIAGFSRSTAAAIAAGVSGVAGGGLGAYIGSTFMRSQDAASAQLRAYFAQPLEFSKYLAAERLLAFIGEDSRLSAVNQMITAIMNAPSSQQSDQSRSNPQDA
ncbi:MAG TPA: hypothetical protein VNF47_21345 [Streptosporangiaceae bacterium]|nr:hypothetical protein [Streptosporangiaceae bacterium]